MVTARKATQRALALWRTIFAARSGVSPAVCALGCAVNRSTSAGSRGTTAPGSGGTTGSGSRGTGRRVVRTLAWLFGHRRPSVVVMRLRCSRSGSSKG